MRVIITEPEVYRMILILAFSSAEEQNKFEYLYNRYKNLLFTKAWQILHDHMLAEDAVSEAYIRIYNNLHKIEDVDSPRSVAFMVTIVRNTALTILKRNRYQTPQEIDETLPDNFDLEESVLSVISQQQIVEVIEQLDEELRNIFVLKYAYDLPSREIALQMGMSENNINVKLYRAKKKLTEIIRKGEYV